VKQVNIHEAKTHLSRLIQDVLSGEEVVIAKGNKPVVRLVIHEKASPRRKPGRLPGLVLYMADDFDEPLEDFAEYME
jgi:prevent-host-death family protein